MVASDGYVSPPLESYTQDPFWTSKPQYTPYRDAAKNMLSDGYSGPMGIESSQALADYVVVDMVARAATGQQSPKDSASQSSRSAEADTTAPDHLLGGAGGRRPRVSRHPPPRHTES